MDKDKLQINKNGITKKHISADASAKDSEEGQLSLDVYQNRQEIVILAPIAGIEEKDIKISITDEVLMIKGERKFPLQEVLDECFSKECFWGNFSRSIVLPENIDSKGIKATFKNGVLIVRIPKVEKEHTKVINIEHEN